MNLRSDERQKVRRDRLLYRQAMWFCYGAACGTSWIAGKLSQLGLVFPVVVAVCVIAIVTAYAVRFDGESRRT